MSSGRPESKGERVGEDHDIRNRKSENDPTRLRAEKFMAQAAAVIKSTTEPVEELPDYVEIVSQIADDNVFEPYFMSHSGPFERNLYANMSDLKSIRKVDNLLRVTKVTAIVSCFFSFGLCLRSCAQASPFFAVFYGMVAADSLRISYNCYIKNYCAIALKNLGGDGNPAKIGASVFQWAQSAMGNTEVEDPFMKLKKRIIWKAVFDKTLSVQLAKKVQAAINSNA